MKPTDSLGGAVIESATTGAAIELAVTFADISIDQLADNDAISAIPVVGSLRQVLKGALGFRDHYLTKKLLALLAGVGPADERDVSRWRDRLARESPSARETGERILALVDIAATTYKAELIGRAFRRYLDGETDRATFLRLIEMIESALTEDLRYLDAEWKEGDDNEQCRRLVNVGLLVSNDSYLEDESSGPPGRSSAGQHFG